MVLIMFKYHLEDVEWGRFKVGGKDGIFKVKNSKPYHKANLTVASNGIPYVTRTSMNNGLEDLIVDENYEKNPKNTISLGAENADFFFQGIEYVSGNKMYYISNNKITREVGLFLVQIFRQSIKECGFGYGKGLTGTRFKNRYVMLPIDENDKPNWHFMEEYIKERENKQKENLREYYKQRLLNLRLHPDMVDSDKWREFTLQDICEINSGIRLTKANMKVGNIPFIGATDSNNGITGFVSNINKSYDKNILGVNYNGSVVENFYHPYPSIFSDDVKRLSFKEQRAQTKFCYIFLKQAILQQKEKYQYAYKFNGQRIARQKILLPIDTNGNPNWEYMENYIKIIEKKKIEQILEYLDR